MTITAQEVFDQTAKHLLMQGERSIIGETLCAYRGRGGAKCAVGYWIPDDQYRPGFAVDGGMEGTPFFPLMDHFPDALPADVRRHSELLVRLQFVHDTNDPKKWREALRQLAQIRDLSDAVLNG